MKTRTGSRLRNRIKRGAAAAALAAVRAPAGTQLSSLPRGEEGGSMSHASHVKGCHERPLVCVAQTPFVYESAWPLTK